MGMGTWQPKEIRVTSDVLIYIYSLIAAGTWELLSSHDAFFACDEACLCHEISSLSNQVPR